MDVGHRGAGSAAIVGIVTDIEETHAFLEAAFGSDLVVKVLDDGDIKSFGAGFDPVFAELVPVSGVHGLDRVPKLVEKTGELLERPTFAASLLPTLAIILKWPKRNQRVVRGAASEHFCT